MMPILTKHHLWMAAGRTDLGLSLLGIYAKAKGADIHVTTASTALIVEGYPRSANTLAVAAVRKCLGHSFPLAHHVHSPHQVIRGVRSRKPVVLLIRDPIDAVSSMAVRDRGINIELALKDYIGFYRPLLPFRPQVSVAEFRTVLTAFDKVVHNAGYLVGRELPACMARPGDDEEVVALVAEMDKADRGATEVDERTMGSPSRVRSSLTLEVKRAIGGEQYAAVLNEATKIYQNFIAEEPHI